LHQLSQVFLGRFKARGLGSVLYLPPPASLERALNFFQKVQGFTRTRQVTLFYRLCRLSGRFAEPPQFSAGGPESNPVDSCFVCTGHAQYFSKVIRGTQSQFLYQPIWTRYFR
jgi:hypothetical protein